MTQTAIRWGRVALGGVLGELLLIVAVIPVAVVGGGDTALAIVAVAGSFLAFVPVAWWLGRSLPRPAVHGTLMGALGAAIYITLSVIGRVVNPDAPAVPLVYYAGHALKLAGGAAGGWLARRAGRAPAAAGAG